MNIDDKHILKISELILRCRKIIENDWGLVSIVYDVGEGHSANSGFLYNGNKIRPVSVGIDGEPTLLSNNILEFQEEVHKECGHKFKQLLIQMEKETGRIKIDFEFDDPDRWAIKPSKIKEMREALRPDFS